MSRVYGDSTPFPHDMDYIALVEEGVDCAVTLATAQQTIAEWQEGLQRAREQEQTEIAAHEALFQQVTAACQAGADQVSDRVRQTSTQILARLRQVVDESIATLSTGAAKQQSAAQVAIDTARQASYRAVESFLAHHTPPGTSCGLRLSLLPEGCSAQVAIGTPFDLKAVFSVAVPRTHAWAGGMRVADLCPGTEIRVPQESGWFSKRVEVGPVRLDRYFITDVQIARERGSIQLRKAIGAGAGFEMQIDPKGEAQVRVCPIDDDGKVDAQRSLTLQGADAGVVMSLWKSIVDSSADLYALRKGMKSARFGNEALESVESPLAVAEALIREMASTVVEISRRSGAPGELVLRRDLAERRREETYLTHTELLRKIFVLPPQLRAVFAPLGLRSPELGEIPASSSATIPRAPSGASPPPISLPPFGQPRPPGPPPLRRPSTPAPESAAAPAAESRSTPVPASSGHTVIVAEDAESSPPPQEESRSSGVAPRSGAAADAAAPDDPEPGKGKKAKATTAA